jgi:hypothetical protein
LTNGFTAKPANDCRPHCPDEKEEIGRPQRLSEKLRVHLKRFRAKRDRTKPVIVTTIVDV